jgi:hypothetical protein
LLRGNTFQWTIFHDDILKKFEKAPHKICTWSISYADKVLCTKNNLHTIVYIQVNT